MATERNSSESRRHPVNRAAQSAQLGPERPGPVRPAPQPAASASSSAVSVRPVARLDGVVAFGAGTLHPALQDGKLGGIGGLRGLGSCSLEFRHARLERLLRRERGVALRLTFGELGARLFKRRLVGGSALREFCLRPGRAPPAPPTAAPRARSPRFGKLAFACLRVPCRGLRGQARAHRHPVSAPRAARPFAMRSMAAARRASSAPSFSNSLAVAHDIVAAPVLLRHCVRLW